MIRVCAPGPETGSGSSIHGSRWTAGRPETAGGEILGHESNRCEIDHDDTLPAGGFFSPPCWRRGSSLRHWAAPTVAVLVTGWHAVTGDEFDVAGSDGPAGHRHDRGRGYGGTVR